MAELKVTWQAGHGLARQGTARRGKAGHGMAGKARQAGLTAMTEAGLIQSIITMRR